MKFAKISAMMPPSAKRFLHCRVLLLLVLGFSLSEGDIDFIFHGFRGANLVLGNATITSNGILDLTNGPFQKGRAFYPSPLHFNPSHGKNISFSTNFVFVSESTYPNISGHGAAFVISPSKDLPGGDAGQFLGIFNATNDGNSSNHVVAVELDTVRSLDVGDINDNHIGIDFNGLRSAVAMPVAYFDNKTRSFKNFSLISGTPTNVWVEYDGAENQLNVTVCPINEPKPNRPLISMAADLLSIVLEEMHIGFSSSTTAITSYHYILGWSFKVNGDARPLDPSRLPKLPRRKPKKRSELLVIGLPVIVPFCVFVAILSVFMFVGRKRKFAEVREDWEREYGPHRFVYKDLFTATRGFSSQELLGSGGFGRVYRGVLPSSKEEVAVKRVSHESRQGMREFIAEIVSLGRLRHRNLVPLLGYCRRKTELLLVYDFMPNGSLDKFLFDQTESKLSWSQRFRIIKDVASGLLYLHEEWEMVVLHRDIKASNVLLDREMNGRLGDFGLARLYDHGSDPHTTHMVGTFGYLAPELCRTAKATTQTDVFAFGAFVLEVACGRRPIDLQSSPRSHLVDLVWRRWKQGKVVEAADPMLGREGYKVEQMELVLMIGLLCCHPFPEARPSMRQVTQFLDGGLPEELSWDGLLLVENYKGFDDSSSYSYPSFDRAFASTSLMTASILSGGR